MRTFAQKQDRLQKSASSGTHVIKLLRAHAEGFNEGLAGTAALRLEHNFSRIPINAPPARAIQAKPAINQPGDAYEQEADRVADQVLAAPAHAGVMRATAQVQRLAGQSAGPMDAAPASVDQALAIPGRPLELALRQDMEQRFGYDFSRVRIHSGVAAEQSARDADAHAYTLGQDIVFGAGGFAPGTQAGRRLIAHELTHVVQQGPLGQVAPQGNPSMPSGVIRRQPRPSGKPAAKAEARLADLAKDPGKAHQAWKRLSAEDRATVLENMTQRYGTTFANRFRDIAEQGKPDLTLYYQQPGTGPMREQLKASGWRFMEMEITGSAAFDVEIWVHPTGRTRRRDVSTYRFAQPKVEVPPPEEESDCLREFHKIRPRIWALVAEFDAVVDRLESLPTGGDRAPIDADFQRTTAAIRAQFAEWHKLRDRAEADGDDDCRSEIVEEENMAGDQLESDLERWNRIK
jgi:hypothetical protein